MNKLVQIRNPKSGHYLKIDTTVGRILGFKKTKGPYKGIKIIGVKTVFKSQQTLKQKCIHIISRKDNWTVKKDGSVQKWLHTKGD